jgi:cell division transport system permease protein
MIAFVGFSLKRAWQGFWRNALMSLAATASMVLMLTLLSGVIILWFGLNATLTYVQGEVQVVAYLNDSATSQDVAKLTTALKAMPQVTTVDYVSKDQALADFRARQPEVANLVNSLPSNPLPASFEISLRDPGDYMDVATYLRGQGAVESVQDIQKTVSQMTSVINVVSTIGIVVLVIVGLTVLFIIVNTIRLAVVARSEEIEIMRLVGASDAFIRWPFVFEGAFVGFLASAITIGLLLLVQAPLSNLLSSFFNVLPVQANTMVGQNVALIVLATGVGIGVVGSYVSVRSYLKR